MRKQNQKAKKGKALGNGDPAPIEREDQGGKVEFLEKKSAKQKPAKNVSKKALEKKKEKSEGPILRYISISGQFLRESKVELKKVKWPTRKELLASTAVVIFLVILLSFFLGLIDFGLIKIIKNIVG